MNLPQDAKLILDLINSNGYQAFAVGGFVRDAIMNRNCGDIDICSSATPQELEALLDDNNIKYVETGIKHGTVSAIINHTPYEITTFRTEGEYLDSRHPESVAFVRDINSDLARRDFTINAIAYNDTDGIVDLYSGTDDIKNCIIRCVGDPDTRFQEDALRIMRAIRFASVLCFDIDSDTKSAIFRNKDLLKNIANERIYTELSKLLLGDDVERVLTEYRDVIAVIIPEIKPCFECGQNSKWHLYDVYTHIVKSVAISPKVDYIRFAVLLHDIGKPYVKTTDEFGKDHFKTHPQKSVEISRDILKRLRFSTENTNKILKLIEIHDKHISKDPYDIKKWMREYGAEIVLDYIDVRIADVSTHNLELVSEEIKMLHEVRDIINDYIANNVPYRICDLAVNGNDLIELGYFGKDIALMLERLIELVSAQPKLNIKELLLNIIKRGQ